MNWIEAIKRRTSFRTYDDISISNEIKSEILSYLNKLEGPFNASVKFSMLDIEANDNGRLGTYGIIKGAKTFVLASTKKEDRCMEQLGYILEKGILYLASLGLGTCWLTGTFKRAEFIKAIGLGNEEILPIITPIGYAKENRSLIDSFMRIAAGSKNRKGFNELFFRESWGNAISHQEKEKYIEALEMVRLAPSASNKQPWRVLLKDNSFHFYLLRSKGYGKAFDYDVQKIDIGIAMSHFDLTMEQLGQKGRWVYNNEINNENIADAEYIITFTLE